MIDPTIRARIVSALTQYDIRASKRKDYNRNALGHYFRALESLEEDVAAGAPLVQAIEDNFYGRLGDVVRKAAGLEAHNATAKN